MNFATGLMLWGEVTGQQDTTLLGQTLYSLEAEAIAEYDLSELSAKQIKKLSNYGAILDRLTPDQIAEVLAENEFSPDGRPVVIMPKVKANPPAKHVRYTLTPEGKKVYR